MWEGRCEARKGEKEGKTSGVEKFSELARPLASAYVCPCDHRLRPSTAISNIVSVLAYENRMWMGRVFGAVGIWSRKVELLNALNYS